ncbi:MAG: HD domain-containing protein [Proteobacteria bacterium]|nr:HD domain-containing protein [Pseudomonadota bacterium]
METVSFTRMEDGTREEYEYLTEMETEYANDAADRVLDYFRGLDQTLEGYTITRQQHGLQSATRAVRDGASEEMVVATLLHDIGDALASNNHGEFAASILRPYVSEETYWIVKHHGIFQAYYYAHHMGGDRNARDRYQDHPCYQATIDFCHKWDQTSFDPDYDTMTLEEFEPMVRRIFAREPFQYDRK